MPVQSDRTQDTRITSAMGTDRSITETPRRCLLLSPTRTLLRTSLSDKVPSASLEPELDREPMLPGAERLCLSMLDLLLLFHSFFLLKGGGRKGPCLFPNSLASDVQ